MMAKGRLTNIEKMVTSRIRLEDIVRKGFEELLNHRDDHLKILVSPIRSL